MRLLYNFSIRFLGLVMYVASFFNSKAKKWVSGRKGWEKKLSAEIINEDNLIWFHCSSLGEFEQGRPVLEELAKKGEKILLTFFSPSGFENLKNYSIAQSVTYLPLDSQRNAKKWINLVRPKAVFFVKYEFWYNYINETKRNSIPLFLISGIFRKEQYFFKPFGTWFANNLRSFTYFFVQDQKSIDLLTSIGINNTLVCGDTRFDRVIDIASKPKKLPIIEAFGKDSILLIAGSTWPEDEDILLKLLNDNEEFKLVLAPHDVSENRIRSIMGKTAKGEFALYSKYSNEECRILIIDEIGLLSSAYQYGQVAYIGGGFGNGIHNTLEAAVFGMFILFGPNYRKFKEATDMIERKGAVSVSNFAELQREIQLLKLSENRDKMAALNKQYVDNQKGGTKKIINTLEELNVLNPS